MKKTGFLLALLLSMAGFGVFAGAQEEILVDPDDMVLVQEEPAAVPDDSDLIELEEETASRADDMSSGLLLSADSDFLPEELISPDPEENDGLISSPEGEEMPVFTLQEEEDADLLLSEGYGKTITKLTAHDSVVTLPFSFHYEHFLPVDIEFDDGSVIHVDRWESRGRNGDNLYDGLMAFYYSSADILYAYFMQGSERIDFPYYHTIQPDTDYTVVVYPKNQEDLAVSCTLRFEMEDVPVTKFEKEVSFNLAADQTAWYEYTVPESGEYNLGSEWLCGSGTLDVFRETDKGLQRFYGTDIFDTEYDMSERAYLEKGEKFLFGIRAFEDGFSGQLITRAPRKAVSVSYTDTISCSMFDVEECLHYLPFTVRYSDGTEFSVDYWQTGGSYDTSELSAYTKEGEYLSFSIPHTLDEIGGYHVSPLAFTMNLGSCPTDVGTGQRRVQVNWYMPQSFFALNLNEPQAYKAERRKSAVYKITAPKEGDYTVDVQTDEYSTASFFRYDGESLHYDSELSEYTYSTRHVIRMHLQAQEELYVRVRTSQYTEYVNGAIAMYEGSFESYQLPDLELPGQNVHVHSYKWVVIRKPTCSRKGIRHYQCSCGDFIKTQNMPMIDHTFGKYQTTQEPTVLKAGKKTRTCKVCGASETKTIAKKKGYIKLSYYNLLLGKGESTKIVKVTDKAKEDSIASCTPADKKIVSVEFNGKTLTITGKRTGSTIITVKLKSGAKATVYVTVQKTVKTDYFTITDQGGQEKKSKKDGATVVVDLALNSASEIYQKFKIKTRLEPLTSTQQFKYIVNNGVAFKIFTFNEKTGVIKPKRKGEGYVQVKSGSQFIRVLVKVWSDPSKITPGGRVK